MYLPYRWTIGDAFTVICSHVHIVVVVVVVSTPVVVAVSIVKTVVVVVVVVPLETIQGMIIIHGQRTTIHTVRVVTDQDGKFIDFDMTKDQATFGWQYHKRIRGGSQGRQ
jgi:hypothetical protein